MVILGGVGKPPKIEFAHRFTWKKWLPPLPPKLSKDGSSTTGTLCNEKV